MGAGGGEGKVTVMEGMDKICTQEIGSSDGWRVAGKEAQYKLVQGSGGHGVLC